MTHDFAKVRTVADNLEGRLRGHFIDAVNAFEAGIEAKEIWNAEYKELYTYGIGRGAENAIKAVVKFYTSNADHEQNIVFYDALDAAGIVTYNLRPGLYTKAVAKAEKGLTDFPKMIELLKALAPLDDIVKELKGYIQKGRKPAVSNKKPEEIIPAASYEAQKEMVAFLKKTSEQFAPELIKSFQARYLKDFETVVKKEMTNGDLAKMKGAWPAPLIQKAFDVYYGRKEEVLKPLKDAKKIVEAMAERDAQFIIEGFLAKNTQKLTGVVARKEKITKTKVRQWGVENGKLNNEIYFEFSDKSNFIVKSSVVYGWTMRGSMFLKYPTRFTQVFKADGSKMSMPSELKMNKEF